MGVTGCWLLRGSCRWELTGVPIKLWVVTAPKWKACPWVVLVQMTDTRLNGIRGGKMVVSKTSSGEGAPRY